MERELIHTITIPNYIRKVLLSKERRAKYYIRNKIHQGIQKLPKKYGTVTNTKSGLYFELKEFFTWKEHKLTTGKIEIRLWDAIEQEYVIANPKTAGTEKWEVINGQKLYNQGYHPFVRRKIVDSIHEFFAPFLIGVKPVGNYPISIQYIFSGELSNNMDLDNHALPYYKCFQDCLTKLSIIKNDTVEYIDHFSVRYKKGIIPFLTINIYGSNT